MSIDVAGYIPFWDDLSRDEQEELSSSASLLPFEAGQVLQDGTDRCLGLLVVVSGSLRAYTLSEEGKQVTLYRLQERDMCLFSASCVFHDVDFVVMVEAEKAGKALHVPAATFQRLVEGSLPAARYLNRLMASRFSDVMWLLDQVMSKHLDSRLAALLVEEEADGAIVVTHERLAGHLGTAREVVTRMLRHFQDEGLVTLRRGRIDIVDRPRLLGIAAQSMR